MNDTGVYLIQVRGQVCEAEINVSSPLHLTMELNEPEATLFFIDTDQSGLIGLMRHLHGLGYVFLSVRRQDVNQ